MGMNSICNVTIKLLPCFISPVTQVSTLVKTEGHTQPHTHSTLRGVHFWCDHWEKTCQSTGPCFWLIILLQKSMEASLIREWTAVRGQRPVCLCGRTPANLTVKSGRLPDFSGSLTASPVHLLAFQSCWMHFPARFTCLPVLLNLNPRWPLHIFCQLNGTIWILSGTINVHISKEFWAADRGNIFLDLETATHFIPNERHLIPYMFKQGHFPLIEGTEAYLELKQWTHSYQCLHLCHLMTISGWPIE